jgi:hypothetical protein
VIRVAVSRLTVIDSGAAKSESGQQKPNCELAKARAGRAAFREGLHALSRSKLLASSHGWTVDGQY